MATFGLPSTSIACRQHASIELVAAACTCFFSISTVCGPASEKLPLGSMSVPPAVTSSGGLPPGFRCSPTCQWRRGLAWLCARLTSRRASQDSAHYVPDQYALTRLVRLIAGAREGERNDLTYWAACRAGEMVASGLLAADVAAAVIAEAATRAGLPRAEAERTARNGVRTTGGVASV